jgi:hypothetical protein
MHVAIDHRMAQGGVISAEDTAPDTAGFCVAAPAITGLMVLRPATA